LESVLPLHWIEKTIDFDTLVNQVITSRSDRKSEASNAQNTNARQVEETASHSASSGERRIECCSASGLESIAHPLDKEYIVDNAALMLSVARPVSNPYQGQRIAPLLMKSQICSGTSIPNLNLSSFHLFRLVVSTNKF